MELGSKREIYDHPLHPYTQALLSAIPVLSHSEAESRRRIVLRGEIPSPLNIPPGCRFASRCPLSQEECQHVTPQLLQVSDGHWVACSRAVSEAA